MVFAPALTTWASFVCFIVCIKYEALGEVNITELSSRLISWDLLVHRRETYLLLVKISLLNLKNVSGAEYKKHNNFRDPFQFYVQDNSWKELIHSIYHWWPKISLLPVWIQLNMFLRTPQHNQKQHILLSCW